MSVPGASSVLRGYLRLEIGGIYEKQPVPQGHRGVRPMVVANWKMNGTTTSTQDYLFSFIGRNVSGVGERTPLDDIEVVLAPGTLSVYLMSHLLKTTYSRSRAALAVQNIHPEPKGAFTGEISAEQAQEAGAGFAIVGHSERRKLFQESNAFINQKVLAALRAGLVPILCVGETLTEREEGITKTVVGSQVREGLMGVQQEAFSDKVVLAYEPVWAIGAGRPATPEQADEIQGFMRDIVAELYGRESALYIRILYGGSVAPDNIDAFMAMPSIDGALVGGASLDPRKFEKIAMFGLNKE